MPGSLHELRVCRTYLRGAGVFIGRTPTIKLLGDVQTKYDSVHRSTITRQKIVDIIFQNRAHIKPVCSSMNVGLTGNTR